MTVQPSVSLLIVEDDENDAALILRALRSAGVTVNPQRVEDDAALQRALATQSFDAVVCDFNLPSYTAFAALDRVRSLAPDLPFVIVSGSVGEDVAVELIRRGANDFVPKDQVARVPMVLQREIQQRAVRNERRRVERALAESRERFRVLVASMEDIVFSLDREQRIEQLYGRGLSSLGVEASRLQGRTLDELVGAQDAEAVRRANDKALEGQATSYEWVAPGGRNFSITVSPLRSGDDVVGVVGLAREVTSQKRAEAQAMLADRMVSIGTLAAGVAHEINNPLASIHSNLSFVTTDLRELEKGLNDDQRRKLSESFLALRDAVEATGRVRDIVRDLKLFSRGSEQEEASAVNVVEVIESALRMARNEIRHRAQLVNEVRAVPAVLGSASRVGQVVLNLIVNAAQAIPDGHAADNRIRVATTQEDGFVVIDVADTGVGMTAETKSRIFTPFFTTKPVGEGTGLGLSICYRILTDLGGRISVTSELGKGAQFRVWLPIADGKVPRPSDNGWEAAHAADSQRRVLVVDDEALIAKAIERALGRVHHVVTTTSAKDGLERIRTEGFDVILCDMMMPDMNGMEFHGALMKVNPGLAERVIFLTGGAFTGEGRRFLEQHGRRRLEKPFEVSTLLQLIDETVRES